jgi:predicted amidohydrolase
MLIALASPCIASSLDEGLDKIRRLMSEASAQGAEIVCFPEAYLRGLRGQDFEVLPFDQEQQERVLQTLSQWARIYAVATILGMERLTETGRQIAAFVIDAGGPIQGYQTKNQLAPSGQCQAYLHYRQEGVLVQAIKVEEATGLLATRYAPERYQELRLG